MKKIFYCFLAIILCLSLGACGNANTTTNNSIEDDKSISSNDEITVDFLENYPTSPEEDFTFYSHANGVEIYSYNGNDEIVVIPETYDGKRIITITDSAFANNKKIKAVKIGNTIETIGGSFVNCPNLEVVVCGASLLSIGECAFADCPSLHTVILNDGLKSLELGCFSITDISEIEIPNTVTTVDFIFGTNTANKKIVIIGEKGSAAEDYVNEDGEKYNIVFQAKYSE